MIYLNNNTIIQELYIPRQDYIYNPTGSGGTYAEGYADGFESGYTSGSTDGFDSGYTEGYSSGETHQKGLLSSTTFTENGEYERENGWSAITVNVEPSLEEINVVISADTTTITPSSGYDGFSAATIDASGYAQENYDSGFDDGFTDGYSSGASEGYDSGYTEGYQSGYTSGSTDGYESGYTSGQTDGYDSGYTSGYTSGHTDGIEEQKALLTTTALTENGSYQRENGWSGVTVNVDTASTYNSGYTSGYTDGYDSGYTSGNTDGFDSGYTSGETHQKSLLGTTAFTINGSYSAENGYSAITVNVPTGETYNIEQNKPFTATSNGNYTITPTSASTIIEDEFYYSQGSSIYQLTATTQGYPYVGTFNLFKVIDSEDQSIGYLDIKLVNGSIYWNSEDWYGGFPHLSGDNVILFFGGSSSYTWTPLEDFTFSYDVMSAVSLTVNMDTASTYQSGYTSGHTDGVSEEKAKLSAATFTANTAITISDGGYSAITVNVPQSGSTEKDIVICTSGGCWFNMNYQIGYGDVFEIEHCTFGKAGVVSFAHQQYLGGNSGELFRIGQSDVDLYIKYFNNSIQLYTQFPQSGSIFEDNTIVYSSTAFTVDGNIVSSYTTNYSSRKGTLVVFANTTSGGDKVENQTAKIGRLKVYASDGTLKATFEPRLDEFNVPYFKYIEQDIDIYASGNTAPFYEEIIIDSSYQSGYTDGQNSIISTFTAMTATTNGVYGSSANPLSSITVDVPQSGSTSVVSLVDSIYTQSMNWDSSKYIDTMVTATTATTMRIGYIGANIGSDRVIGYDWMDTGVYDQGWRYFNGYNDTNTVDFINSRKQGGSPTRQSGVEYDITLGNNYLYDNINETYLVSQSDVKSSLPRQHSILVDVGSQKVKFVEIKDNGVTLFYGQAAIDNDGNIGLYDSISQSMFYNSGLSMTYDGTPVPISQDYQSGYTDGQNSIISTFTAITATTNGVYGSSASPYSSITINVPQTGSSSVLGVGSFSANGTYSASTDNLDGYSAITIDVPQSGGGVKYVEYIQTDGTKYGWEIPLQIGYNSVIEMDFMPLSGSPNSDGWYSFFGTNGNSSNLTTYWGGYNLNDVGGNFLGVEYSPRLSFTSGTRYLFELDNTGVRVDNVQVSTVTNVSQSSSSSIIYINSGNDFTRSPIARYYGFKVYDNGTLVWDLRPCLDSNNNPCFYETISEEYYYHTKFDSSQSDPTAGPLLPTEDYLSGYTDGMAYQKSLLGDFTATTNGSFSAENGYSGITVLVPQTSSFGDLYCLYCDENCIFDFPYTINSELASIDDIHFSALPLSDFTIVYKGDLDGYDLKMGNMKWTDEGNGYYHFSGNWETYYNTYNTNDSTSRAINDFPNMHFFDWKIYATKTYSVDSDDLTISSGGGAPTHTSDLSISGNSYYLGNVSVDNQYCLWYVAVDSDGNGCLRMGNEYKYPRQGNCYPVYRKLVNGTYVYRIVKPANESSSSSTSSDIDKLIDRSITSIEIPNGVKKVGSYAFDACSSLSSVTIPNSVTSLEGNSFAGCTSLSAITIPSGVTSIGNSCFNGCSRLDTIYAYPTTAPTLNQATSSISSPFRNVASTGTVHYPQGSDYSSWQSARGISGWTFVGDL